MINLKKTRSRISPVNPTIQIAGAMKMVSAAKLKKTQDAIIVVELHAYKLKQLLERLSSTLGSKNIYNPHEGTVKRMLLVVIIFNRGLCGAFNTDAVKRVIELTQTTCKDEEVWYYTIGKKGNDALKKTDKVLDNNNHVFDRFTFANAASLVETLVTRYTNDELDQIVLVYSSFKSAATQILTEGTFLPIQPVVANGRTTTDYFYKPSKQEIATQLIPCSFKTQLFKALYDSIATGYGAHMAAMRKITNGVQNLKSELIPTYNKARQATITSEIIEIVGGSEVLS